VGLVEKVKDPALRITAAEDRARSNLMYMLGMVKANVGTAPSGVSLAETQTEGAVRGAVAIDWYAPKKDALCALLVVVR
jgi:hypothetical protein